MSERLGSAEFKQNPFEAEPLSPYGIREFIKITEYLNKMKEWDKKSRAALPLFPEDKSNEESRQIFANQYGHTAEGVQQVMEQIKIEANLRQQWFDQNKEVILAHRAITNRAIETSMKSLDQFHIWSHKFRTGQRPNEQTEYDSWYYRSKNGASLRFRLVDGVDKGLSEIIEPIADKVIFFDRMHQTAVVDYFKPDQASFQPKVGRQLKEYFSQELIDIQDGKKPYNNTPLEEIRFELETETEEGEYVMVCDNLWDDHLGHAVNYVEELS